MHIQTYYDCSDMDKLITYSLLKPLIRKYKKSSLPHIHSRLNIWCNLCQKTKKQKKQNKPSQDNAEINDDFTGFKNGLFFSLILSLKECIYELHGSISYQN